MQQEYEKLGAFYLGRPYDLSARQPKEGLTLYDSRDLTTHAVCVGMTGSGKTGLCLGLLEEAAIDGIPAIVIDPKGDIGNLLLSFPDLRAEDFEPWVNEDDARRKGLDTPAYAAQQAELWKKGLAAWNQDGDRIRRMHAAAEFDVFTPGSDAGLPVSILKSFAAPSPAILEDREALRERINATVTSLLALVGVEADPLQSREHILLATLLDRAWREGLDLDLPSLIQQVQKPPVVRIGVLELEAFYSSKERFGLAMQLNNLLASPGFEAWLEGDSLDIDSLLYTNDGKPRISIFSIAHLSDTERMFFVSLLLNQVLSWVRMQSGTTSLRALLYMDEIFGYFPPVQNPPSKMPLLTLLKQARAFGLGVVLATQNPVDLDYKGLANCGTWFIGRLQTERDKERLLDGLEGAAAGGTTKFDRAQMGTILSGLGNRIFLMNNVHEDGPEVFETRWVLSYLRGPLTRTQIKTLMAARKRIARCPLVAGDSALSRPADSSTAIISSPPVLPPEIAQYFLPLRRTVPDGSPVYFPMLLGVVQVQFSDTKLRVNEMRNLAVIAPLTDGATTVRWDDALELDIDADELESSAAAGGSFQELPAQASNARNYSGWSKEVAGWVYAHQKIGLYRSSTLKEVSQPGESERDFRIRLQQAAREQRDAAVQDLRRKYAPRASALEDRIVRARQTLAKEQADVSQQHVQTAVSIGSSLLGALFGRKLVSQASARRVGTAARSIGRSQKESADVARAEEALASLETQRIELDQQLRDDVAMVESRWNAANETLEEVTVRPKKTGIAVRLCALAWAPYWREESGSLRPAWE